MQHGNSAQSASVVAQGSRFRHPFQPYLDGLDAYRARRGVGWIRAPGALLCAVHLAGGRVVLQLVQAGRYARSDGSVTPSRITSRNNPLAARERSEDEIFDMIEDFANAAMLAKAAGYDGVEDMGSQGPRLRQFLAPRTNLHTDSWRSSASSRQRLPAAIVRAVRARCGARLILVYRQSRLPAGTRSIPGSAGTRRGSPPTPTWRTTEPSPGPQRGSGRGSTCRSWWRINTPELTDRLIADGKADMDSMARPFLSVPDFVAKARAGKRGGDPGRRWHWLRRGPIPSAPDRNRRSRRSRHQGLLPGNGDRNRLHRARRASTLPQDLALAPTDHTLSVQTGIGSTRA